MNAFQRHRASRAKRGKRAMRSGANSLVALRNKRYQSLANTQSRAHPTITARQNQVIMKYKR